MGHCLQGAACRHGPPGGPRRPRPLMDAASGQEARRWGGAARSLPPRRPRRWRAGRPACGLQCGAMEPLPAGAQPRGQRRRPVPAASRPAGLPGSRRRRPQHPAAPALQPWARLRCRSRAPNALGPAHRARPAEQQPRGNRARRAGGQQPPRALAAALCPRPHPRPARGRLAAAAYRAREAPQGLADIAPPLPELARLSTAPAGCGGAQAPLAGLSPSNALFRAAPVSGPGHRCAPCSPCLGPRVLAATDPRPSGAPQVRRPAASPSVGGPEHRRPGRNCPWHPKPPRAGCPRSQFAHFQQCCCALARALGRLHAAVKHLQHNCGHRCMPRRRPGHRPSQRRSISAHRSGSAAQAKPQEASLQRPSWLPAAGVALGNSGTRLVARAD
mmetsp:Transcript_7832/g.24373  ORF Transcript_7832/g.24373 Transcript_7832/m.24373 type:complete len:387 (+) Transcript_7832:874-2034(+)